MANKFRVTIGAQAVVDLYAASAQDAADKAKQEIMRCIEATGQELLETSPPEVDSVDFHVAGSAVVHILRPPRRR